MDREYLEELAEVLSAVPRSGVSRIVAAVLSVHDADRQVFVCGNGGSAATSSHFACDLAKGTSLSGCRRLRVVALTDNIPLLTAWGNDNEYADVFSEQLRNLVREGDLLVAISGSGNSPNVLRAVTSAKEAGAVTAGLSGFEGGQLARMVDIPLVVPCSSMEQIEDAHLAVCHAVAVAVRQRLRQAAGVRLDA